MAEKSILVLGAGIGGVVAAQSLRKKLGRNHRIVVIDRKTEFEFAPSFLWLMMGWRTRRQISRSLFSLDGKGIAFVNGSISKIDPDNRIVLVDGEDYRYDYLIISLGADLAPGTIPGLEESSHHMYQADNAEKFRAAVQSFDKGTLAFLVASTPFKCPAAPYEAALLVDYLLRKKDVRHRVNMRFFTVEPQPMPVAGPRVGEMIKQMLSERGIEYEPNQKLVSVELSNKELSFEKGEKVKFDLLLAVPPHRPPAVVRESELADGVGWIPVNGRTLKTKYDDVYAIGDVTAIKLPSGMMLPKAGVFAERHADVVANNIASEINGSGEIEKWDGKGSCFIETGYGKAGYASGDFFAEPKPLINPRRPGRIWHWSKVLFEKYWLWRHF